MAKTAFVLSGGGAKGSFQIGVLKKFHQEGIKPDVIYGTSVGALNAIGWAYAGIEETEKAWLALKGNQDIIRFRLGGIVFSSKGMYSNDPLYKIIKKIMAVSNDVPINSYPVVSMCHLISGDVAYVTPDNVHEYDMEFADAVLASTSLPLVMQPVNNHWIDGGVKELAPLRRAIEDGCNEIYVILTEPYRKLPEKDKQWIVFNNRVIATIVHHFITHTNFLHGWLGPRTQTLAQKLHDMLVEDLVISATAVHHPKHGPVRIHVYAPNEIFVETLEFDPEKIRKGISLGERAVEVSDPLILES